MGNKSLLHIVIGENQIQGGVARFTEVLSGLGTLKEFPSAGPGNWFLWTEKTPSLVRQALGTIVTDTDLMIARIDVGNAILPATLTAFVNQAKAA